MCKWLQISATLQKVCTKGSVWQELSFLRDAWGRLRRQFPIQLRQDHLVVFLRLGVAAKDQLASVRGGKMDIQHLHGGELFQDRAWRQARRQRSQAGAQVDV